MRCVTVAADGVLVADGSETCTGSQFVLMTQAELDFYTASPFRLSVEDGALLSAAIIAVWAVAHYWRALMRALDGSHD